MLRTVVEQTLPSPNLHPLQFLSNRTEKRAEIRGILRNVNKIQVSSDCRAFPALINTTMPYRIPSSGTLSLAEMQMLLLHLMR